MTTTQYLFAALLLLATSGIAVVLFRSRLFDRLAGLSPTTPDTPGDDDREASGEPVEHTGASEEWGAKLHAMRNAPAPVDLPLKAAEQMVVDHEALAAISTALDDFDRTVSDAISRFLRNQPTVLLRLPSSIEHPGEFDRRELDAMLAGAA